jgi:peptidoglycan/xylan/chitin deacetylase (PgdA/CDA1 family)
MWTIDTRDWARRYVGGDQEILNIVLSQAHPGAIVLMHMHVDNTVRALPAMIEGLQAAGYKLSW